MSEKSKKIRIIAGPNGSGKSTILRSVKSKYFSGAYVNADEIQELFNKHGYINPVIEYNLKITDRQFTTFIASYGKSWTQKVREENGKISVVSKGGIISANGAKVSSYDCALVAEFIRLQLLKTSRTFTFETVLSHPSKIRFLQKAKQKGYKIYLYYICTIDPSINIERVRKRVLLGGHHVSNEKITKRFYASLDLVKDLIPLCHRAYFFDNSPQEINTSLLPVAEINPTGDLILHKAKQPWWLNDYVLNYL